MEANNLYVACIDLTGKRCLVVGAGPVGHEKTAGLLAAGATVQVVAPEADEGIHELALRGAVEWSARAYESTDLDGRFLVIAATGNENVNQQVHDDAEKRSMLVNVADVTHLCNFILPAIVRDGPLAIAISTAGASPALAKRMKREAGAMFGPAYARLAEILESLRPWSRQNLPTYDDRKHFFEAIVNGDPDPIELLQDGEEDRLRALIDNAKGAVANRSAAHDP
jgi:siroheme synthase-like protein